MTFAARDFSPRRGVSDEHIPQWICEERATKSGRKRPAALRVAPNLACGFVARRLQPHGRGCALLAPRHRPNWAQRTSSYLCLRPLSESGRHSDESGSNLGKTFCSRDSEMWFENQEVFPEFNEFLLAKNFSVDFSRVNPRLKTRLCIAAVGVLDFLLSLGSASAAPGDEYW